MTQHELLTQLDEFTADEANAGRSGQWAAKLIREAAAEIRRLSPPPPRPKVTAEEYAGYCLNEPEAGL